MKSKFEQYLENQSDHLDIENPDLDRIWDQVSKKVQRRRRIIRQWSSAAAIGLLLVSIGLTAFFIVGQSHQSMPMVTLAEFSQEIADQDQHLQQQVNLKYEEIKAASLTRVQRKKLSAQMEELDNQLSEYYSDLIELAEKPRIMNGILRCSQTKLRILDRTLSELNK